MSWPTGTEKLTHSRSKSGRDKQKTLGNKAENGVS
jgi:hypothetical protein